MKSSIHFLSILLATTLIASDDPIRVDLSPFTVYAVRLEEATVEIPSSEIRIQRPADLAEMLANNSPGVQLVRKGGASNDLRLNGIGDDNLNVLQDDQRVYCACPNRMDPPASHTETTTIERIEIVSGAFDLRHSGALGGTISVITRDPSAGLKGDLDLTLGSFDFRRIGFSIEDGTGQFAGLISASYVESAPYEDGSGRLLTEMPDTSEWTLDDYQPSAREIDAYREARATSKVVWVPSKSSRHVLHVGYRHAEDVLYPALRMDADLNESASIALTSEWSISSGLIDSASLDIYFNTTQHDMSDRLRMSAIEGTAGMIRPSYVLDRGYYMESLAEVSTGGFHFQLDKERSNLSWRTGFEGIYRAWNVDNRIGAGMTMAGPGMEIFSHMIPDTTSLTVGAFGEGDWAINERWTLTSGLRLDRFETEANASTPTLDAVRGTIEDSADDFAVSGKLMLRARLGASAFAYGGIGHTARPPNAEERYINLQRPGSMANWVGNPDLSPPRMTELTVGSGWNNDHFTLHARGYIRQLTDYIYPERSGTEAKPIQTFTAIDAEIVGFELSAHAQLNTAWQAYAGASWQRARKLSQPLNNDDTDLAEIPGAALRAQVEYRKEIWFVIAELQYNASQSHIDESLGEHPLTSATVVHLRTGMDLPFGGTLLVGVENLFDRTYSLHNAYVRNPFGSDATITEPGRSLYLRYQFSY